MHNFIYTLLNIWLLIHTDATKPLHGPMLPAPFSQIKEWGARLREMGVYNTLLLKVIALELLNQYYSFGSEKFYLETT